MQHENGSSGTADGHDFGDDLEEFAGRYVAIDGVVDASATPLHPIVGNIEA